MPTTPRRCTTGCSSRATTTWSCSSSSGWARTPAVHGRPGWGEALGSPTGMLRGQLAWAITHGMTDRVRLLAEHGADVTAPFEDGDTPAAVARTTGHADLVSLLVSYGAAEPSLPPLDDFIAAAVAARGRERRPRSGPGTDRAGRRPE